MPKRLAALAVVIGTGLAAAAAGAEGDRLGTSRAPSREAASVPDGSAPESGAAVVRPRAAEALSDAEMVSLERLAAEAPELADQSGGYVSNEELLTILLVVVIVLLIL